MNNIYGIQKMPETEMRDGKSIAKNTGMTTATTFGEGMASHGNYKRAAIEAGIAGTMAFAQDKLGQNKEYQQQKAEGRHNKYVDELADVGIAQDRQVASIARTGYKNAKGVVEMEGKELLLVNGKPVYVANGKSHQQKGDKVDVEELKTSPEDVVHILPEAKGKEYLKSYSKFNLNGQGNKAMNKIIQDLPDTPPTVRVDGKEVENPNADKYSEGSTSDSTGVTNNEVYNSEQSERVDHRGVPFTDYGTYTVASTGGEIIIDDRGISHLPDKNEKKPSPFVGPTKPTAEVSDVNVNASTAVTNPGPKATSLRFNKPKQEEPITKESQDGNFLGDVFNSVSDIAANMKSPYFGVGTPATTGVAKPKSSEKVTTSANTAQGGDGTLGQTISDAVGQVGNFLGGLGDKASRYGEEITNKTKEAMGNATHTMPDGTEMPGATHEEGKKIEAKTKVKSKYGTPEGIKRPNEEADNVANNAKRNGSPTMDFIDGLGGSYSQGEIGGQSPYRREKVSQPSPTSTPGWKSGKIVDPNKPATYKAGPLVMESFKLKEEGNLKKNTDPTMSDSNYKSELSDAPVKEGFDWQGAIGKVGTTASAINNLITGYGEDDKVARNYYTPEEQKYKDRSDPSRKAAMEASRAGKLMTRGKGTTFGQQEGSSRAYAGQEMKQMEKINNYENQRFDQVQAQNTQSRNQAQMANLQLTNKYNEQDAQNKAAGKRYIDQGWSDVSTMSQFGLQASNLAKRNAKQDKLDAETIRIAIGTGDMYYDDQKVLRYRGGSKVDTKRGRGAARYEDK